MTHSQIKPDNAQTKRPRSAYRRAGSPDYDAINRAALHSSHDLVPTLLPHGKLQGREWVARNPLRADRKAGSFKINLNTGQWGDFATDHKGGDLISLYAYLFGLKQAEAARKLADILGLPGGSADRVSVTDLQSERPSNLPEGVTDHEQHATGSGAAIGVTLTEG